MTITRYRIYQPERPSHPPDSLCVWLVRHIVSVTVMLFLLPGAVAVFDFAMGLGLTPLLYQLLAVLWRLVVVNTFVVAALSLRESFR